IGLLRTIARVAQREPFDLIQVRNLTGAGCLALWLRRRTGARVVFQFSFPTLEGAIGDARRGERAMSWGRRLGARLAIPVRGWMLRRVDLVLAVSEAMREWLIEMGVDPHRVITIPLGAEMTDRAPGHDVAELRERLDLGDAPMALYAGAIAPARRLDVLIRAWARLVDRHGPATLVLVGPSSFGEADRLGDLAASLGVDTWLRVLAPVPRSEIPRFITAAAVAVSPLPPDPIYRVSSPTKTVEALALGCPVVVTPIRDQAELVEASGGGLVAPFDAEALAGALACLMFDPERARAMGAAGRAFVERHRTYERIAERIEERYESLLGRDRVGC
ncbi:MAG TPA: glycosyltransferase, partial [Actinomycetota bacterium]